LGISEVEDTGEPFAFIPAMGFLTTSNTNTHSVVIKESDNIIKIDAKYLPDEIFNGLATETYVDEKIESINYPV
jgi:hypothetical protein